MELPLQNISDGKGLHELNGASLDFLKSLGFQVYGLPPPQIIDESWPKIVTSLLYLLLSVVGFLGNSAVISLILHMLWIEQARRGTRWMSYPLLLLSVTDLAVTASLPPLALQTAMNNWLLGQKFCRIHQFLESMCKTFTPFSLLALAWQLSRSRRLMCDVDFDGHYRCTVRICVAVVVAGTFCLLPILYYSKLKETTQMPMVFEDQSLVMVFIYHFCFDSMSDGVHLGFLVFQLCFCGIVPMLLFFIMISNTKTPNISNHSSRASSERIAMVPWVATSSRQKRFNSFTCVRMKGSENIGYGLRVLGGMYVLCHGPAYLSIIVTTVDYTGSLVESSMLMYYVILVFANLPFFCSSLSWLCYISIINSSKDANMR